MTRPYGDRPPVLGPVILITIGVLALMQNLGHLPASFWPTLWRLWPVLLVLIGVEILLGQARLPWAASFLLALLLITVTIGGVVYLAMQAPGEAAPGTTEARHIETDLRGVRAANVRIEFGAGELRLGATSGDRIMEGEFAEVAGQRLNVDYASSEGQGDLKLSTAGAGWPFSNGGNGNRWDVRLNDSIPLALRIEAGLSTNTLDLSELSLSALRLEAGLSTTHLVLPATGDYTAHISCGLSNTTITVPPGVAARITVSGGLSTLNVDEARFRKSGDTYTSPDYATASNRVELRLEGGMAAISVR